MWHYTFNKNNLRLTHKRQGIFANCQGGGAKRFFEYGNDEHAKTAQVARHWLLTEAFAKGVLKNGYRMVEGMDVLPVKCQRAGLEPIYISYLSKSDLSNFTKAVWFISLRRRRLYRWTVGSRGYIPSNLIPYFTLNYKKGVDNLRLLSNFFTSRHRGRFAAFRKFKKTTDQIGIRRLRLARMARSFNGWVAISNGYQIL
jgi:hypothetical protein